MQLAPKTVCTCLAVLALSLWLASPAGALGSSPRPVIAAPLEEGLVSLGRLLDGFDGFDGWWSPWNHRHTVTTKCTEPDPPEGSEDDSCGAGQDQDPNGSSGTGGTGGTSSGTTPGG